MTDSPGVRAPALSDQLALAADAILAVRQGRSLNDALAQVPGPLRPGVQALCFEALRHLGAAEAWRRELVPKAPAPWVDALLLTVLAWLARPGDRRYADHTLLNQAVEAAKSRKAAAAGFVNAVLRRALREPGTLAQAQAPSEPARHNHPGWWIKRLRRDWPQEWEALLAANNEHPPMVIRVNARHVSTPDYLARLQAQGIQASICGPQAIVLAQAHPVQQLPGFDQGDVSVQDLAAQWAAPGLIGDGLPAGARVLDACAAPGGKTAHLLELADLDVLALDVDESRLKRVHENLARLKLQARTIAADASQPATWWDGQPFDAILLDAPCSASGIVRRHPDVRWLRRPEDIDRLAQTQAQLLDAMWPLLKPGGRLLFATCSMFKAEGEHGFEAFLQRTPDAQRGFSPGHCLPLTHNGALVPAETASVWGGALNDGFYYGLATKAP